MIKPRRRIRTQLVLAFSLVALLTVAVFGLFNFMFVYTVEDVFFERLVEQERIRALAGLERSGFLPEPSQPFFTIAATPEQLPLEVARVIEREPGRVEVSGDDGRYYHLARNVSPDFVVVAEVSEFLVVRTFRKAIFTLLSVSALVLLSVAVLLAVVMGNRLGRPIESLARLMEQAKAERLPVGFSATYPNNEVGILAEGLEAALARVAAFIEREQRFTREVSHELRTPVTVIKGALEVLQQTDASVPYTLLQRINVATESMEQSIETLLLVARESSEQHRKSIALLPVVEAAVVMQSHRLEGKPVTAAIDVEPDIVVQTIPGLIDMLLNNLVGNAFQYTQQGSVVIAGDAASLTIADTGAGIDLAVGDDPFMPFKRSEASAGFGVGLSIVKRLCEHQGWRVDLDSSSEGTRVTVYFGEDNARADDIASTVTGENN